MNLGIQNWKKPRANFSRVWDDVRKSARRHAPRHPWDAHCFANPPARLLVFKVIRGNGFKMNS